MALPSDVTEAYLQGCHPELRKFWKIVDRRARADIQHLVSERTSLVSEGKCIFRDKDGEVLFETPDPPPPVSEKAQARDLRIEGLEQRVAKSRELGLSNAAAVDQIHKCIQELAGLVGEIGGRTVDAEIRLDALGEGWIGVSRRLTTAETKTQGIQAKSDREGRGIFFRGAWQEAIDYEAGAIVTSGKRAYVAIKSIRSGGGAPGREGGGWTPMFDSTQIPRSLENVAEEVAGVIRELVNPLQDRLASLENEIASFKK